MIYNHLRLPVWEWGKRNELSLCPDCNHPLVARRPEHCVYHWAHKSIKGKRTECYSEESNWHLAMKMVYAKFGYDIEVPYNVNGSRYRIDAAKDGKLREFVHSLSPFYENKHKNLSLAGLDISWIYDGSEFVSSHFRQVAGRNRPGFSGFLKPRAIDAYRQTGGLVHFNQVLFKEWKDNVFYQVDGQAVEAICKNFNIVQQEWLGILA